MNEGELITLIQETLDQENDGSVEHIEVTAESAIGDEGWDSLGHLSVLAALDKKLGGKVASMKEMASADSVKSIIGALKAHGFM